MNKILLLGGILFLSSIGLLTFAVIVNKKNKKEQKGKQFKKLSRRKQLKMLGEMQHG